MNLKWAENSSKNLLSPVSLYCCIVIFFLYKLTDLFVPYFWDELGVYAKASLYMYDNHVTLLPGVIPDELSRGHPLLCAALFGTFYKLLGPSVWAGHLTALMLSCTLILVLYLWGRKMYGQQIAAIACLLLMVQPVFIAQSSMVLPEILLALICFAAIFFYINNRLALFALFSSLAILTKETAIAVPVTIWFVEICKVILSRTVTRETFRVFLASLSPLVIWGAFLLLQKSSQGWYFFPLHVGYVSFSLDQILPRLCYYLSFLFKGQGRLLWTAILTLSFIIYLYKQKIESLPIIAGSIEELRKMISNKNSLLVLGSFICWGLIVSMFNFHFGRYTLFILPPLCLIVAKSYSFLFENIRLELVRVASLLLLILTPLAYTSSRVFQFDGDMGYSHLVMIQQQATAYLDKHFSVNDVVMSSFPINLGLMETRAGYTDRIYRTLDHPCTAPEKLKADVFIYSYPGNLEYCNPNTEKLLLLKEFASSFARVSIYARK